jgi:nucleotide-binding universal stress UspA family protein
MKAIVAGYDGTEQAERALARAAELAQALEAKLVVVSVDRPARLAAIAPVLEPADPTLVSTGVAGPVMTGGTMPLPTSPEPAEPAEGLLLLERARRFLVPRRVDADYVSEVGDPVERLLQVADDREADLIVVGSPERGLLDRLLGHGVDEKLARRTHRDVLLVH